MNRTFLTVAVCLGFAGSALAAVPFVDELGSAGPDAGWLEQGTFGTRGTWETVDSSTETDWRGLSPGAPAGNTDGFIGKLSWVATGPGTVWREAGEITDTDYSVAADVYAPVVNAASGPDAFLYQGLLFFSNATGYGRIHFHQNTDTTVLASGPVIRLQTTGGGFDTPLLLTSPTDFTAEERWWEVRVDVQSDGSFEAFLDGTSVGSGTISASQDAEGYFGVFTFINDSTGTDERAAYFDNFRAVDISTASIDNWTAYD